VVLSKFKIYYVARKFRLILFITVNKSNDDLEFCLLLFFLTRSSLNLTPYLVVNAFVCRKVHFVAECADLLLSLFCRQGILD
jgi:hypothetical protein